MNVAGAFFLSRTFLKQIPVKKKFTVCSPVRFTFTFLFSAYVIEGCVKCFEELTAPGRVDTTKEERISLDALYVGCKLVLRNYMWGDCPKDG